MHFCSCSALYHYMMSSSAGPLQRQIFSCPFIVVIAENASFEIACKGNMHYFHAMFDIIEF